VLADAERDGDRALHVPALAQVVCEAPSRIGIDRMPSVATLDRQVRPGLRLRAIEADKW